MNFLKSQSGNCVGC